MVTLDAQGQHRVLRIDSGATVTLNGLRITGGNVTALGGGGILSYGDLSIIRSQIDGNTVAYPGYGGGIYQLGGAGTNLDVVDSTISNNFAYGAGGIYVASPASIVNSTVSSNDTIRGTGGIEFVGAGPHSLINSTVTKNRTSGVRSSAGALLHNSIVAGNFAYSTTAPLLDIIGTFDSASSHNVVGRDTSLTNGINNGVNNNQVGGEGGAPTIDAKLGILAYNGGPTQTHSLLADSPAIDRGNNGVVAGLQYDQRGPGFPRMVDGGLGFIVDIGAFEYAPSGSGMIGASVQLLESALPDVSERKTFVAPVSHTMSRAFDEVFANPLQLRRLLQRRELIGNTSFPPDRLIGLLHLKDQRPSPSVRFELPAEEKSAEELLDVVFNRLDKGVIDSEVWINV